MNVFSYVSIMPIRRYLLWISLSLKELFSLVCSDSPKWIFMIPENKAICLFRCVFFTFNSILFHTHSWDYEYEIKKSCGLKFTWQGVTFCHQSRWSQIYGHDKIYDILYHFCMLCIQLDSTIMSNLPIEITDVMLFINSFL